MQALKRMLIKTKSIKQIQLSGVKEDRKAVIPGGLAIMIAIFEELSIGGMTIADGALREGVMYDLMGRKTDADLREVTVVDLKKRYELDASQSNRVSSFAIYLQNSVILAENRNKERRKLLIWACELYEIGLSISHNDYHKHGAYILQNSDLAGFSKPEQTIIAELVRSHRGSVAKVYEKLRKMFNDKIKYRPFFALLSFRLAVIFNRSRKDINWPEIIQVEKPHKNGYDLVVNSEWLANNPLTLFSLNEELSEWAKFGYQINLIKR